ncbi:MAG: segregation/condensation protein A, partial [Myxococcales bacterium]|nr:segregation/condensation protein A [Myxococcales bacterium]
MVDPTYFVNLGVFEGPLDLLLHLVRRHELDILDIPISFICEKYLEYLEFMRALDLEIAGDYLVMAATLAYLKSRELLPSEPEEVEEENEEGEVEDPREALIRRLLEYEKFKAAAHDLDALPVTGRDIFERGHEVARPDIDPGLAPISLFRLAEAYQRVLSRAKIRKSHEVTLEPISVPQRMQQLTLLLDRQGSFDFEALFLERTWSSEHELRSMLVVTLMSLLELAKIGVIHVQQMGEEAAIRISRRLDAVSARAALRDFMAAEGQPGEGLPELMAEAVGAPTTTNIEGEDPSEVGDSEAEVEDASEASDRSEVGD